jgi:hypothetical protein
MSLKKWCQLNIRKQRSYVFEVVVVLVIWLRVAWPFIRPGTYVYGFDTVSYTGPATRTVFDAWHQLQVPLWSDKMFGGVPFLGRLGAQALYFPNLPFSFFSLNTALDLSMAAHLLLLGIGFLVFIRSGLRLAAPAGSFVAVSVLASAFVGVKTLSFDQLVALACLPWILYFAEKVISQKNFYRYVAGLSVSASALILGGHPQFIYLFIGFSVLYIVTRIADTKAWHSVLPLSVGALLILGVTALQVYATYSLNSSSVMAAKKSIESLSSPAFLLPTNRAIAGVIGNPFSEMPIGVTGAGEAIAGFGFAAVLLAIVGCFALWSKKRYYSLVALFFAAIISVSLSFGPTSKIFEFFYKYVPGFGSARVPGRLLAIALVSIVILAAHGICHLGTTRKSGLNIFATYATLVFAILFALVSTATAQRFLTGTSKTYFLVGIAMFIAVLFLINSSYGPMSLIVFLLIFTLVPSIISQRHSPARSAQHTEPFETARSEITDFLRDQEGLVIAMTYDRTDNPSYLVKTLRPNTNILNNIELIDGYDGGMWVQKRWVQSMKALTGGVFNNDLTVRSQVVFPLVASVLARLGVRWALVDTEVVGASAQLTGWNGPLMTDRTVQLWENPDWRGIATIYVQSIMARSETEVMAHMKNPEMATIALVEDNLRTLVCTSACSTQSPFPHGSGIRNGFETNVPIPSIAAIHVSWSQDWQVYVNGVRTKQFPINENQVGVLLPAGHNDISYQYMPRWYQPLLVLMIVSLLILICIAFSGIHFSTKSE